MPWMILLAAGMGLVALELVFRRGRRKKDQFMRDQLRRAKRETREIAQLPLNNPYPLIQIAADGELLFINPVAERLFSDINEKGRNHPMLSGLEGAFANAARGKRSLREVIIGHSAYYQTIIPAQVQDKPALTIYCYDITERKKSEQALEEARIEAEKARAAAEAANRARGDFLANMSHELRTPMNGIIGLSDILKASELPGENRELAEVVNRSARNLLNLLNDILDFSKIEAGELTVESIPFSLRQVAGQVEALQRPVAEHKGISLRSKVEDTVPEYIVGDPSRLQQVLNNLINNAIKFTKEGSVTLAVSGKKCGEDKFLVDITVTDTGIGIPSDKQEKVFAKFQQADSSTARNYGGTGLGLTITRDLVTLMGGRISITSEVGKGTTFSVTLPAAIAQKPEKEKQSSALARQRCDTAAKLLLVDDNQVNLMVLRLPLQRKGFTNIAEAHTGKQAVALAAAQDFDLIFMDCQMPEMDGFEATRQVRSSEREGKRPAIIAVTADAMADAAEKCRAAGMDDYISKPIDMEKLDTLLHRWIPASGRSARTGSAVHRYEGSPPPQSGGQPQAAILDLSRLNRLTNGDRQITCEALRLFLEGGNDDIRALESRFSAGDYHGWVAISHKLYGSASSIGANDLAASCNEGQALRPEDAADIARLHPVIIKKYEAVRTLLEAQRLAA